MVRDPVTSRRHPRRAISRVGRAHDHPCRGMRGSLRSRTLAPASFEHTARTGPLFKTRRRRRMVVADFGSGEVFLSMLWFFLFVIWFWLIIAIFSDIFRSHDMSGVAKAGWSIFVIVLPFIGIFTYLIARGGKMTEHAVQDAQAQEDYFNARVQSAVGGSNEADQLAKLASLREQGVIDDTEFAKMKAKVVA